MAVRLFIIFMLVMGLAGCLKNASNQSVSVEPAATEEAATLETENAPQEMQDIDENDISAEVSSGQVVAFVKPSVQEIQQALKNANLYEGKLDGILGPKTREAIEAFQSQNGLKKDGKVGPKTWEKLQEYLNIKAD